MYDVPQDYHSFPTRRSSDLHGDQQPSPQAGLGERGQLGPDLLDREVAGEVADGHPDQLAALEPPQPVDRKSTRLNSSHSQISYAVICLKKKTPKGTKNRFER